MLGKRIRPPMSADNQRSPASFLSPAPTTALAGTTSLAAFALRRPHLSGLVLMSAFHPERTFRFRPKTDITVATDYGPKPLH